MNLIFISKNQPILDGLLLGEDMIVFIQWWLLILILGFIFVPLSGLLFSKLSDKGYLFSKIIGIAVSGYLMWMLSVLKILKYTTVSCIIALGIGLAINAFIVLYYRYLYKPKSSTIYSEKNLLSAFFKKENLGIFITEELLFLVIFLIFTYIRGFKPEAYGTEKFMDYGFMTTMMRNDYMPPQDFWFSGTHLNYYYVGQFLATFLTRLSFVDVSRGYNLMLMMTGAFTFVLPFSIGYNLIIRYGERKAKKSRFFASIAGLFAGAGVCIAGNMHYPIYGLIIPFFKNLTSKVKTQALYWFPDATRYIGYNPETKDKTIHEFPAYSFILGDLHAHVINIIFVLTVLAILLAWLFGQTDRYRETKRFRDEVFNPQIILIAFFIGLFHSTNYWDYPIYFVVSGAIILFSNMIVYGFMKKAYILTAIQGIFIFLLGEIFALPFTLQFDQISASARLAENHTPLYQLLVLWGLPIFTLIAFLVITISDYVNEKKKKRKKKRLKSRAARLGRLLSSYMNSLTDTDLFVITIGLCSMGLVLLPEIVYVKDIYSGDYKRANTMFKLTYQAFIMFGICFGYIYVRILYYGRAFIRRLVIGISLFSFALTLLYPINAVNNWNFRDKKGYKGIDATLFMKKDFKNDYLATRWLIENVSGTPVVLEANDLSYSDYQRVSVITGLPTVLGWYTHEQLWRSGPDTTDDMVTIQLNERASDIRAIYTSEDINLVRSLIEKYDVSFIYVGQLEEKKFEWLNHDLLRSLGEIVFMNPDTDEYDYSTYIIKVDRIDTN